jgi:hypothetical protein
MSPISTTPVGRALGGIRSRRVAADSSSLVSWGVVVVIAAVIGAATVESRTLGLLLAAVVLAVGVFVADPLLLVVLALPAGLVVERVGGATTNLSAGDAVAFLGGIVSLFYVRWKDAYFLKQFLRGVIWYQAVLIVVVIAHPNHYDIVEWFHRFSYLAATVLIGWVVAVHGRTRQAFRLYLIGASILAVWAMVYAVRLHFEPAQWGLYQKNAIGDLMWVAIVIAQVNPPWARIGTKLARVCEALCILGLLSAQSRQSAIMVILALVVAFLLNPEVRQRSRLIGLSLIPVVGVLYYSFSVNARNNPKFNSVSIRINQISEAVHIWHMSPILGEGMRYYNLPALSAGGVPPNVIVDNLASTGVVGSLAFLVLVWITMRTMIRLPYALGTLGLVVLLAHYVDGLFDIFWIGGPSAVPLIVAGISLGMSDQQRLTAPGQPSVRDLLIRPVETEDTGDPVAAPLRSLAARLGTGATAPLRSFRSA